MKQSVLNSLAKATSAENLSPKYGRISDAQCLFGLARGTIYNLLRSGRIRGCSLQVKGKKSRIRLIDLSSVSALIESEMSQQQKEKTV